MKSKDRPSQPNQKQIYEPVQEPDEIRVLRLSSGTSSEKEVDCELVVASLPPLGGYFSPEPPSDSAPKARPNESDIAGTINTSETASKHSQQDIPEKRPRKVIPYEAVSWCWGKGEDTKTIRVKRDGKAYDFYVSPLLEQALKALRHKDEDRYLWIDAICIDQGNLKERNSQVPKMDRVYGGATNVCVWIGPSDDNSNKAIDFISEKVLEIWDFDDLCQDELQTQSWGALINLMRRDWFSRRWVVQEIALAKKGTLYCGSKNIDWQDFADAVSLFVHVETATHLLSDVMKRDRFFGNRPDYFGDVSTLGAALLVDATRNLFRESQDGKRHPRLSLEHLISKYSVFEASQPRDTIYAFLSIAKDTKAQTAQEESSPSQDETIQNIQRKLAKLPKAQQILKDWGKRMTQMEAYAVDYSSPVEAVYRDFIIFSIQNSMKTDPTRALDVICRPWAPAVRPGDDSAGISYTVQGEGSQFRQKISQPDDTPRPLPSWIPDVSKAPFAMIKRPAIGPHMERKNADPLAGLPTVGERNYSAAGTRKLNTARLRFKTRGESFAMCVEGFVLDEVGRVSEASSLGNVPPRWPPFVGWIRQSDKVPEAFWRTLVADRGPHGQNPPTFYPRACKEAMNATLDQNVPLDTKEMIHNGQCTIIAEFLRRVQAVIWNRRMMYTKYGEHLGLIPEHAQEGDLVCIFYGCSVPVLLRKQEKASSVIAQDFEKDVEEATNLIKRNWKKRRDMKERLRNLQTLSGMASEPKTPPRKQTVTPTANDRRGSEPCNTPGGRATAPSAANEDRSNPANLIDESTDKHKTPSPGGSQFMQLQSGKTWSYLQVSWSTLALFYVAIWVVVLADGHGNSAISLASLVHVLVKTRIYFHLGHLLVAIPLVPTLIQYVRSSRLLQSLGRQLKEKHTPARKPAEKRRKAPLPHIQSEEWTKLVKDGIADGTFELPWSATDYTTFDADRAVREAVEPRRSFYTLIGECYVHQMMDGEAIDWQAKDSKDPNDPEEKVRKTPRVFELR